MYNDLWNVRNEDDLEIQLVIKVCTLMLVIIGFNIVWKGISVTSLQQTYHRL